MDWKHINDIDPQRGESYIECDESGRLHLLHFFADIGSKIPKWRNDNHFGFDVTSAPVVAALIDIQGAMEIHEQLRENQNG